MLRVFRVFVVCTVHLPNLQNRITGPYFDGRPEFELIRREERKLVIRVNS